MKLNRISGFDVADAERGQWTEKWVGLGVMILMAAFVSWSLKARLCCNSPELRVRRRAEFGRHGYEGSPAVKNFSSDVTHYSANTT